MSNSPVENWMYDHNWTDKSKVIYNGFDMEEAYDWGKFDTDNEQVKKLRQRCEALEGLLKANVRVIKAELKKELSNEGGLQCHAKDGDVPRVTGTIAPTTSGDAT